MTEAEWLACDDPGPLLEYLREKASVRKLRLFACACYRRAWPLLSDMQRRAVEAAEEVADGSASLSDWGAKVTGWDAASWGVPLAKTFDHWVLFASDNAPRLITQEAVRGAAAGRPPAMAPAVAEYFAARDRAAARRASRRTEQAAQAASVRDLFGNPFRPAPAIDPAWRTSQVIDLAQAIYDGRAFDRLPVLADALEDAGCADPDLLAHCRGTGPHVRGCWAVDLLLGKE